MGKEDINDLSGFLQSFPQNIQDLCLWLRDFIWDLYPESNELIYDNYNALAIGFSLTEKAGDVFCSIAVYTKHVNFGFNRGSEIDDPEKIMKGEGSLYRHIPIKEKSDLPKTYIKKLLKEAYQNAVSKLKGNHQSLKGETITKSISGKQRRPK